MSHRFSPFSPTKHGIWEKFDDGTPNMEIAVALCEANGLPMAETLKMLEQDGWMWCLENP